jgi:hypothetical protein
LPLRARRKSPQRRRVCPFRGKVCRGGGLGCWTNS